MELRKIIIDTDPGIDDGFALLTAMACKEFDIRGIMTVSGNKSLEVVTPNALRLVDFENRNIPVFEGAKCRLVDMGKEVETKNDAEQFHGKDGMGASGLPYTTRCLKETPAYQFLLNEIRTYPHEIELITLGPLTNIALAIQEDKETMKKLKSITIMGGSFYEKGNTTPYSEFNIWFDSLAAKIVVQELAEAVPVTFMGLDATHSVMMDHRDLDFLSYVGGERGELLERIYRPYLKSYFISQHVLGGYIHDLYTVLAVIDPSVLKEKKKVLCDVINEGEHDGQTMICENGKEVTAAMKLDGAKLKHLFMSLMLPDQKELVEEYYPCIS